MQKTYMNSRSFLYIIAAVSAVLLFAHLGKFYVDIMEARNFVSAREMAQEGNWIFTTMNGEPRYEKPPLPTWLSAFMGNLFSFENIGALRFPAALSCFALILYFFKIVETLTENRKLAFVSSLVLISSFLVIYVGRRANWDIYSYSFMVIGIYYFLLALKQIKFWQNFLVGGILFGLSVLSKGPTGPYVLLVPFYAAHVITAGFPKMKVIWGILFCALITVLVGFSWYLYIYAADPETFLAIMKKEALARENRDVKPFTRYLNFPVQTGVWAFFSIIGLIFPMMKKRTDQPKKYMLFFFWAIFSLILLSLIPSKKERYLFPMMVPLAATTGFYLDFLFRNYYLKKWELTLNKVIFIILMLVSLAIAVGVYFLPVEINLYVVVFSVAAFICAILMGFHTFKRRNFEKVFYAIVFLMISTALFGIPVLDQMLSNHKNKKELASLKPLLKSQNLKMYTYEEYSPEVWFRYAEILPEIKPADSSTFPKEKVFYIASNNPDQKSLEPLKNLGWKIDFIGKYDDNEQAPPSKNYTDRKIHFVYKVEK